MDASVHEVVEFMRNTRAFFLATVSMNDAQPHVRPFGAACEFEGHLYLVTSNQKKVYDQIMANPKIAVSAFDEGKTMRFVGTAELDERREARVAMMEACPNLADIYTVDDGVMVVFRIDIKEAIIA